jgi:antitoxin (DNA-binding transcriptional repressor) of toxin-antitoxin stability system
VPFTQTINASEFKAKCLDILDRLAGHELDRVVITKRGRIVAVLTPPEDDAAAIRRLHGFMRGSVTIPPGVDLTEPVTDEAFRAADGELHG